MRRDARGLPDATDAETAQHIREWVRRGKADRFAWPTDGCGYTQHIRFVKHRNLNLKEGEDFGDFALRYADTLDGIVDWQGRAERAESRARLAAQRLIERIGADGPESLDDTAARAVSLINVLTGRAESAEAQLAAMRDARDQWAADAIIASGRLADPDGSL